MRAGAEGTRPGGEAVRRSASCRPAPLPRSAGTEPSWCAAPPWAGRTPLQSQRQAGQGRRPAGWGRGGVSGAWPVRQAGVARAALAPAEPAEAAEASAPTRLRETGSASLPPGSSAHRPESAGRHTDRGSPLRERRKRGENNKIHPPAPAGLPLGAPPRPAARARVRAAPLRAPPKDVAAGFVRSLDLACWLSADLRDGLSGAAIGSQRTSAAV